MGRSPRGAGRAARRRVVPGGGRASPERTGRHVRMKPEVIYTKSAPKTGFSEGTESPIAQGVKCGQFLFVSGQGPLDPATKEIVSPDLAEETRVTAIEHVVKVGVFLRRMDDFPVFNRVFKEYFKGVQPARTTVEASAPRQGVNVEIDCIAWIP